MGADIHKPEDTKKIQSRLPTIVQLDPVQGVRYIERHYVEDLCGQRFKVAELFSEDVAHLIAHTYHMAARKEQEMVIAGRGSIPTRDMYAINGLIYHAVATNPFMDPLASVPEGLEKLAGAEPYTKAIEKLSLEMNEDLKTQALYADSMGQRAPNALAALFQGAALEQLGTSNQRQYVSTAILLLDLAGRREDLQKFTSRYGLTG